MPSVTSSLFMTPNHQSPWLQTSCPVLPSLAVVLCAKVPHIPPYSPHHHSLAPTLGPTDQFNQHQTRVLENMSKLSPCRDLSCPYSYSTM